MEKYLGVKLIEAEPQSKLVAIGKGVLRGRVLQDGYKVIYEDGYESWSPKDAFEKAYRKIDGLTFGLAIEAMKLGYKVARKGWNGKGMYLYYVPASSYAALTDAAKKEFGAMVPYCAYIAMKTAQGNVVPWLASQTDMLSEDWCIVEDEQTAEMALAA